MMNKLLSGRFIFTIIAAVVFLVMSTTGALPIDKVQEILLIVIYAYFSRPDRKKEDV